MNGWFIIVLAVVIFYSALGLVSPLYVLMFGERVKQNALQKSRLRISVILRIAVIAWGFYCLIFVLGAGNELVKQMFKITPAIALCLIFTDENTLKWLDSKIPS